MDILNLNKKVLEILAVWPVNDQVSTNSMKWTISFVLSTMWIAIPVLCGSLRQIVYGVEDVNILIDGLIGIIDYLFYVYVVICFLMNFNNIKDAISIVNKFQKFCPLQIIHDAENEVQRFTKAVLAYAIIGLCINSTIPLLNKKHCSERNSKILQERDPCGLIVRAYFPIDVSNSPYFELAYLSQAYCTIVVVITVLCITLCLLGLLIHLMAQISNCKNCILNIFATDCVQMEMSSIISMDKINFCIQYHIAIIHFSYKIVNAFSSMMLIHLTMTSVAISALGYQIINGMGTHDSLRFIMHLGGWLLLLFFTCFYGQKLIDKSSALAVDAYDCIWYTGSIPVQKNLILLIMRAQQPLRLTSASLGVMSYETFLQVLKTAYSYLTLLLAMIE